MFPLHVLVVEESPAELERITRALTDAGYRVSSRSKTLGARADILMLRPDMVLLDPFAPGLRGDDLALLLGLHPETADTAVVFHCSKLANGARPRGALGVIHRSQDADAFLREFTSLAEGYLDGALPKEDRAVIAERRFSGTHKIAAKATSPELSEALPKIALKR